MSQAKVNATEEWELAEAKKRGRPTKVGSKAWHAQQAAEKSGEGEDKEADKNIHTQLQKVISVGKHVTFKDGNTHEISPQHAHKALGMMQNAKPNHRLAIQNSLAHSLKRFHETLKTEKPVIEPAKPKVSLAKSAAEPMKEGLSNGTVLSADRGPMNPVLKIDSKSGTSKVFYRREPRQPIKVETITYYDPAQSEEAEEKREGQGAPKGAKVDMTKDSCDRMQAMSPQAFKQKFKVPPTAGNVAPGGEDAVYGKGKFSVAEEKTLNNLYVNLSEENKEIFDQMMQSEEGIESLLDFARKQGF